MKTSNDVVDETLNLMKSHTKHWQTDDDLNLRTAIFGQALERLHREIGLERAHLAIGIAGHNLDVPEDGDGFEEYATDSTSNAINRYAILGVTPQVIIDSHGHIKRDSQGIEPDPTNLWARRRVSQVSINNGAGHRRSSGTIATRANYTLHFEHGKSLSFPEWEDELSDQGIMALDRVISEIKRDVFARATSQF